MGKFISAKRKNGSSQYLINADKVKRIEYHNSDRIWIYYTDGQNDHISFMTIEEAQEIYSSILNQLT